MRCWPASFAVSSAGLCRPHRGQTDNACERASAVQRTGRGVGVSKSKAGQDGMAWHACMVTSRPPCSLYSNRPAKGQTLSHRMVWHDMSAAPVMNRDCLLRSGGEPGKSLDYEEWS